MALTTAGLLAEIETAFAAAYSKAKGGPLPEAGAEDRRLLFEGVARGLLVYLAARDGEFLKSLQLSTGGAAALAYTVSDAELNITP